MWWIDLIFVSIRYCILWSTIFSRNWLSFLEGVWAGGVGRGGRYITISICEEQSFLLGQCPQTLLVSEDFVSGICQAWNVSTVILAASSADFELSCLSYPGVDSSQSIPAFYHTRPLGTVRRSTPCDTSLPNADAQLAVQPASAVPEGCRYSRRVRGLEADNTLPLEAVERSAQLEKSLLAKDKESPQGAKDRESLQKEQCNTAEVPHVPLSVQDGEGGHRVVEGSKKSDSMNVSLEESIPEEDNADGADRADCKCPSSSRKGPSNNLSGRTPKGSSDSKHVSAHAAKKASRLKKCPWLATKRRRRLHSTPAHRHEMINHSLDAEELSGEESMDAEHSPSMKLSEGWERDRERPPSRREHSPMSAANPANVNDPSITRRRSNSSSSSNIPAPQAQESVEVSKQEASGGHSPRMEGPRRKSAIARSLDMELMVVATDSGISSESNGDSRDSLDHNNSNRNNGSVSKLFYPYYFISNIWCMVNRLATVFLSSLSKLSGKGFFFFLN